MFFFRLLHVGNLHQSQKQNEKMFPQLSIFSLINI